MGLAISLACLALYRAHTYTLAQLATLMGPGWVMSLAYLDPDILEVRARARDSQMLPVIARPSLSGNLLLSLLDLLDQQQLLRYCIAVLVRGFTRLGFRAASTELRLS